MAEHKRDDKWQWCDTVRYAVFDQHSGIERVPGKGYLVSLEVAFEYISDFKGWEDRKHILKIDCISAFSLLPVPDTDT